MASRAAYMDKEVLTNCAACRHKFSKRETVYIMAFEPNTNSSTRSVLYRYPLCGGCLIKMRASDPETIVAVNTYLGAKHPELVKGRKPS